MDDLFLGILILVMLFGAAWLAWFFLKTEKYKSSLLIILGIALSLRLVTSSDNYLHAWDERYHALVAKNLINHPLKPTLHEHPVLPYDNSNWVGGNIFLGKPSFPLWGMAVSIYTFGNTLFAIRLPSLLLGLLAVWLTYLMGRNLFNERVGLLAAFFHAINGLVIELVGGRVSSDHVELCFIVMVQLAIYFALRFSESRKNKFAVLVGVFMGFAFLSKWYPAFIVLPVWGAMAIINKEKGWRHFVVGGLYILGSFLLVILPWTLYMLASYPKEMQEILFNAFSAYATTVEGHRAPFYYYFNKLMVNYGELIYLTLIGFIYIESKKEKKVAFYGLLVWGLLPLFIFSFADTKRFTYLLISAPAFFLISANFWFYLKARNLKERKWHIAKQIVLVLLIVLPVRYTIERSKLLSTSIEERATFYQYSTADLGLLNQKTIVFGTANYIEMMFHTDVYAAYHQIPSQEKMQQLITDGFELFLEENGKLTPISF